MVGQCTIMRFMSMLRSGQLNGPRKVRLWCQRPVLRCSGPAADRTFWNSRDQMALATFPRVSYLWRW